MGTRKKSKNTHLWITSDELEGFARSVIDDQDESLFYIGVYLSQMIKQDESNVTAHLHDDWQRFTDADVLLAFVSNNENDDDQGSHWSLLRYSRRHGFEHIDSIWMKKNEEDEEEPLNKSHAERLANNLARHLNVDARVHHLLAELQGNDYDCGVYAAIYFLMAVGNDFPFPLRDGPLADTRKLLKTFATTATANNEKPSK